MSNPIEIATEHLNACKTSNEPSVLGDITVLPCTFDMARLRQVYDQSNYGVKTRILAGLYSSTGTGKILVGTSDTHQHLTDHYWSKLPGSARHDLEDNITSLPELVTAIDVDNISRYLPHRHVNLRQGGHFPEVWTVLPETADMFHNMVDFAQYLDKVISARDSGTGSRSVADEAVARMEELREIRSATLRSNWWNCRVNVDAFVRKVRLQAGQTSNPDVDEFISTAMAVTEEDNFDTPTEGCTTPTESWDTPIEGCESQ